MNPEKLNQVLLLVFNECSKENRLVFWSLLLCLSAVATNFDPSGHGDTTTEHAQWHRLRM